MAFEVNCTKDIKSIRREFQKNGVFYSSLDLAKKLKSYLADDISEVYDPTCGAGALLSVFGDNVKKYGQELDSSQVDEARKNLVNCEIVSGDTLANPAFFGHKFRAIIANPPFSVKWEQMPFDDRFKRVPALAPKSKADWAFILHCLYYLDNNGKAACLDAHGVLFRGGAEYGIRKWVIENNFIERLVAFGSGYFVDTSFPTVCLVLAKNKPKKSIVFEDTVLNISREVTLAEIRDNDYNLNFSRYIRKEEPKVCYDYKKETDELLEVIKETLRSEIDIQYTLAYEVTPPLLSFEKFINDLQEILDDAKKKII